MSPAPLCAHHSPCPHPQSPVGPCFRSWRFGEWDLLGCRRASAQVWRRLVMLRQECHRNAAVLLGWPKSHPFPSVTGIFQGDILRPGHCLAPQSDVHSPACACCCLTAESTTWGLPKGNSLSPSFLPHWREDFHQKNELLLLPYLFILYQYWP